MALGQISHKELAREHEKSSRKKAKRLSIEKADNGGYVVEHHTDEYPSPKHAFKDGKEMMKHVHEHMCPDCGMDMDEEDEKGEMKEGKEKKGGKY